MTERDPDVIEQTIAKWHQHLRGQLPGGLDELLHDDVVFWSPIVHSPQRGKDVTKLYLGAAGNTFGGDGARDGSPGGAGSSFSYRNEVMSGNTAVLEFETTMDGIYVNGIDMITVDDDGLIVEFKVMIRPLKAVETVHAQMRAMLEKMSAGS